MEKFGHILVDQVDDVLAHGVEVAGATELHEVPERVRKIEIERSCCHVYRMYTGNIQYAHPISKFYVFTTSNPKCNDYLGI
jgi:hypothetical protein